MVEPMLWYFKEIWFLEVQETALSEISVLMQENNQKNSVLREENMELAQKLKTLVEQYELREQHIDKVLKHKDLEAQLAEAKLAKITMSLAEEKEKFLREKQKLLEDLTEYQKRCHDLAANEVQLRSQLGLYTDKYQEFQDTLTKSNQVFTTFRGEMEKMSKKIKKLEKETGTWKQRWESSSKALVEMAEEKQKRDLDLATAQKKIAQLEKLCRALQADRSVLQGQLKELSNSGNVPLSNGTNSMPDVVSNSSEELAVTDSHVSSAVSEDSANVTESQLIATDDATGVSGQLEINHALDVDDGTVRTCDGNVINDMGNSNKV